LAKAGEILAGSFILVATNVPYLTRQKQNDVLREYAETSFDDAKGDLASMFIQRSLDLARKGGSIAFVCPQNWLFLPGYKKLRKRLLDDYQWDFIARLGPGAFQTPMWDFNVMLYGLTREHAEKEHSLWGIDVAKAELPADKAASLYDCIPLFFPQEAQKANLDCRIVLDDLSNVSFLSSIADSRTGTRTADNPHFLKCFWEQPVINNGWVVLQSTVGETIPYGGRETIVKWDDGLGELRAFADAGFASIQGMAAWNKRGVCVSLMSNLRATLYIGDIYDMNCGVVWPREAGHLAALWAFCSSEDFNREVRKIDQQLKLTTATLVKVPFVLAHWQKVAAEKYPDGLPKPHSDDPTQWLFNGHPKGSEQPLHVAVARLLGYRWPRQTGSSFPDCPALGPDGLESFADEDGIVCLPPVNREQPAAARLRQLLTAALGAFDERTLIAAAGLKGSKSKTLEDWLRDEFFEQHAKLFHDRPFIWQLWDGRPDGFHALINYHKLDHAALQKLTYSYLGNWIQQQSDDAKADKPGAAERLGAARTLQTKLAAILEGEAPLDIFVRWKPLKAQSEGWHPDRNDGIRQNIRPFIIASDVGKRGAGLFRTVPLKLKDKDRGTEPTRPKADYPWFWCEEEPGTDPIGGKDFVGKRWNDVHLTLEIKRKDRS
jgi:hypothetical protein